MSEFIPVRFSHLLGFAGIGAIVRAERDLYTVIDTSKWQEHCFLPYVERVRSSLEIDEELHEPPKGKIDQNGRVDGATVPGIRFPSWMRCRSCGLLHWQWWRQAEDVQGGPPCVHCGKTLDQYPWVMIDSDGRMDDVPWHWLLHRGGPCREERRQPHLFLRDKITASSPAPLERLPAKCQAALRAPKSSKRWTLCCRNCGESLVFDEREAEKTGGLKFFRHQPWRADNPDSDDSAAEIHIIDVSDPRLYAAPPCSALVIPPESRVQRGSVLDRLYSNRSRLDTIRNARKGSRNARINAIASEMNCTPQEIHEAIKKIDDGYPLYDEILTPGQLLEEEYRAITTPIPDLAESEDFVPFHRTEQWCRLGDRLPGERPLIGLISQLIEIKRLREVRVFRGFQRLDGALVLPHIEGESSWLPAIDLFGEGIFFTLSEAMLQPWEQQPAFQPRLTMLRARYAESGLSNKGKCSGNSVGPPNDQVTARFMLLHTLAHLLIRQLEASAGYPAASLKERLYCGPKMAAVLIYVAVPDIAGSLGGLSELAEPARFFTLFSAALAKADWCSLDPVCSEHEGQGPHLLNFAACHGCALIPEPACLLGNELLDRTFIKGDARLGIMGIVEQAEKCSALKDDGE